MNVSDFNRNIRLKLWGFGLVFFIASCGGGSGSSSNAEDSIPITPSFQFPVSPSSIQEIADTVVSRVDGIFLYIEKTGEEPLVLSAGIRNRDSMDSAAADDLFKIASISKLYIAVAVSKLVSEGSLLMTDSLRFWLPDIGDRIANAESISIRHMIEHRSGIPDFDSQAGFSWQNPHSNIDDTLEFALDKPADFSPDSRFEYSNTNYLLLGKIMDTVLGYSHHDYIRDEILLPLGADNTFLLASDINSEALVSGYWENRDRRLQDYAIPGGSMISTAEDVGIFLRALNTGDLLSAEDKRNYAYWFNHSGWLPGYQSQANYYSDIDTVLIQFVNTTGSNSETLAAETVEEILRILRSR